MPEKANSSSPEVILYTDGACSGNPGPGGWGYVLRHPASGAEREGSGGEPSTTNNRMELLAVIRGLESLKRPTRVRLVSDSMYVGQGLIDWMPKWKKNNWRRGGKSNSPPVKNVDLWKELDALKSIHNVTFVHVRGHSGHPENERCDQLAVEAYQEYL